MVVMFYDILDYIFVWISIVDSWNRLSKFFIMKWYVVIMRFMKWYI